MESSVVSGPPVVLPDAMDRFERVLRERRTLVYDYLDAWPGAADFKPQDIYDGLFSYIKRRGKALRPLLVLLSCGAAGGDESQAVPVAAAVEVFHTWTLVHDDIIDRDDMRRGFPTVHALYRAHAKEAHGHDEATAAHYGAAVAILAGDVQQSWTYALLGDVVSRGVEPALALALVQRMATRLTPHLMEGEMLDVQYSLTPAQALSEEQILHMLTMKTGPLLEYAAWAGATVGLGGRADGYGFAEKLGRFASLCGTAFQLHDDMLGLTGDASQLGKPVGSDLRQGKRTLLVYKALAGASVAEKRALTSTLGNETASEGDIAAAVDIMQRTGAFDSTAALANRYIDEALSLLHELPPSEYVDLLHSWATFILTRQH